MGFLCTQNYLPKYTRRVVLTQVYKMIYCKTKCNNIAIEYHYTNWRLAKMFYGLSDHNDPMTQYNMVAFIWM